MSDITKCVSENCPYKNTCLRGIKDDKEDSNPYQSWCDYTDYCNATTGFDSYIKVIHT